MKRRHSQCYCSSCLPQPNQVGQECHLSTVYLQINRYFTSTFIVYTSALHNFLIIIPRPSIEPLRVSSQAVLWHMELLVSTHTSNITILLLGVRLSKSMVFHVPNLYSKCGAWCKQVHVWSGCFWNACGVIKKRIKAHFFGKENSKTLTRLNTSQCSSTILHGIYVLSQ